ncbi:methyltransferase-like protein 27 [Amphiura filiformis]|uniref:methyltransferase-like protein 27 n=1 Tax=Amphiura filiformis TaxID=82378 RepID=UPI003B2136C1
MAADSRLDLPNTIDGLRSHYDQRAASYDENSKQVGYNSPRVTAETLANHLKNRDARILDLCCGTGLVGEQLKNIHQFANIDGIDMSKPSLKVCQEKQIYKSLMCATVGAKPLDIANDTYDALVCAGSFYPGHLNQSSFPEMVRLVKPGGIIVVAFREELLRTADEFNDNKFDQAIQKLVDEKKWTVVSRKIYPGHFHDKQGIALVFKVQK